GQVLATTGSANYYLETKDAHFSPKYDVMFDGFRQPGSSIKPISYITGLDDLYAQYKKFGMSFLPGTVPTPSMAIGTLEIHMIDLLSAYGAIANGGVLMPQQTILEVKDHTGKVVYPTAEDAPVGKQVASPQASYIINNILEGNTIKSVNAYWARWMVTEDGKRRPAAYKTGTTDESKDIDAFGYVAPPKDPNAPAIAVGVWMGNSDAAAVQPVLSTTTTAPLWNRIITEVTKNTPIAKFQEPNGIVERKVDAWSGTVPGPGTVQT